MWSLAETGWDNIKRQTADFIVLASPCFTGNGESYNPPCNQNREINWNANPKYLTPQTLRVFFRVKSKFRNGTNSRTYKTSLTSSLFSKVLVPSQESDWSCSCMLGVYILHLSTILVLDFGTVSTILYFLFSFYYHWNFIKSTYCNDGCLVMMINISNTTQKLLTLPRHLNTSSFVEFTFFSICFVCTRIILFVQV